MKKLSLYIFLVLMWGNVGFAEQIEISCPISNISSNITLPDVVRFKDKKIKLLIDTDEMRIYDKSEDFDLLIIHGIEGSANITEGISTSAFAISEPSSINEEFNIELAKVEDSPENPEDLLARYKEIFFKHPLTGTYKDFIQMKDGSKVTLEDVKSFSERKFFKMKVDSEIDKDRLKELKKEYQRDLQTSRIFYSKKEKIKERYGKVYNYFSILKIEHTYYLYRGHVFWGGIEKKGIGIDILDPQTGGWGYPMSHPIYHYEQKKHPFSFKFHMEYEKFCD